MPNFSLFFSFLLFGRQRVATACNKHVGSTSLWLNGGLLIASGSRLSKIAAQGTLEPKTEYYTLPIVRPRCQ
jgi:hypothetical protein